ncbi:MAG: ATP-dependent Clp protease adapter ClpS [Bdellovibrionales bacterium]
MSKTKVPITSPDKQDSSGVDVAERPQISTPRMFAVVLLNDDYTPMDFVILVLRRFFGHNEEAAQKIMLDVHQQGSGVAGVFTLEVAEMKTMQVNQFAKMNQHPLKSTLREVS